MSKNYIALGALIGGGTGSLDKIDGAILSDGDGAQVTIAEGVYHYHLNATSGAAENSPYVISPDTNPGTKRWVLVTPAGAFSHVRASTDAGQSIPNNSVTTIIYEDKEYDTLDEYNAGTGVFTATHTGYYSVVAQVHMSAIWGVGENLFIMLYKNGSVYTYGLRNSAETAASINLGTRLSCSLYLTAAQYIDVRAYHTQGASTPLIASGLYQHLSIDRIA